MKINQVGAVWDCLWIPQRRILQVGTSERASVPMGLVFILYHLTYQLVHNVYMAHMGLHHVPLQHRIWVPLAYLLTRASTFLEIDCTLLSNPITLPILMDVYELRSPNYSGGTVPFLQLIMVIPWDSPSQVPWSLLCPRQPVCTINIPIKSYNVPNFILRLLAPITRILKLPVNRMDHILLFYRTITTAR